MTVEFRRSSEFSLAEVAAVFTASYKGYFIPFVVDESLRQPELPVRPGLRMRSGLQLLAA